ncbi:hypothetical protein [Mycobacterium simiae]|nr:hypothetical protein [Mycobacterium simiae]PLV47054.1 hypothetical protein X011_20585 [Mycobacterium tuberculosis variant microti OV254]BBX43726.1 hypothetical protein MSIM_51770 [Mycobacterium simiae]
MTKLRVSGRRPGVRLDALRLDLDVPDIPDIPDIPDNLDIDITDASHLTL